MNRNDHNSKLFSYALSKQIISAHLRSLPCICQAMRNYINLFLKHCDVFPTELHKSILIPMNLWTGARQTVQKAAWERERAIKNRASKIEHRSSCACSCLRAVLHCARGLTSLSPNLTAKSVARKGIFNVWTLTDHSALERIRYQQCQEQRIKRASVPLSLHRPAASETPASPESLHRALSIPPRAPQSLHRPLSVVMATGRLTSSLCHSRMLMQSLRNNLHYSSV